MKLILAIVNNDDASSVVATLTKNAIPATKMASTGGFLRAGNTTFLIGVSDSKVEKVIEIIKEHSRKRIEVLPETSAYTAGAYAGMPVEVTVGGATVFVMDVERFEKTVILSEFYGNERLKDTLQNSFFNKKFFHAYLIDGKKGSGKTSLAHIIAKAILCSGDAPPCEKCVSCRKAERLIHPDLITVQAKGSKISVDDIRLLVSDSFVAANDGENKVYIIECCEKMTKEAQNALLKTIEEPPGNVHFILLCENKQLLLETIVSRCVHLHLNEVEDRQIEQYLLKNYNDIDSEKLKKVLRDCGGVIGKAAELMSDGRFYDREIDLAQLLINGKKYEFFTLINAKEFTRESFGAFVEKYAQVIKNIIDAKINSGSVRLPYSSLAQKISTKKLLAVYNAVSRVLNTLVYNPNIGVTYAYLLSECWEEVY